jgi:putative colanic acid biosynthesis glycosyltransferase
MQAPGIAELVIVDGASEDGTLEVLRRNSSRIHILISEPDSGVYAALNKAVAAASGHWILFLGSDDYLAHNQVLAQVEPLLHRSPAAWAVGTARYEDGRHWTPEQSPNVKYRNFFHHQAIFYRTDLLRELRYDESLRLQADYELNLRIWLRGSRPMLLPLEISVCQSGGLSDRGLLLNYREEIEIRRRFFSKSACFIWDIASWLRFLRKKLHFRK